ncbi:hypothetical protein HBE96_06635 [Clostridium sp. P21]|uniref:Uncharacterized protein n=1 Tax=Clostridium muellerianum TaxID=2716538 RepID=A0A7Y0HLV9_9CLOT|nr:hypothetical protein [Clostridium muellerianum]NMM62369.1 hypothetical protein [Clostridium muellerianum]
MKILLCTFKYTENIPCESAKFKYESKEYMAKNNKTKLLREVPEDIFKESMLKLLKFQEKLLSKTRRKLLRRHKKYICKSKKTIFRILFTELYKKELNSSVSVINSKLRTNINFQLKDLLEKRIHVNYSAKLMNIYTINKICTNNFKELLDINKERIKINRADVVKNLLREDIDFINSPQNKLLKNTIQFLYKVKAQNNLKFKHSRELSKSKFKILKCYRLIKIDNIENKVLLNQQGINYVDKNMVQLLKNYSNRKLEKYNRIKFNKVFKVHKIYKNSSYLMKICKYNRIIKVPKVMLYHKLNVKKMYKLPKLKFLNRLNLVSINKMDKHKLLKNKSIKNIDKFKLKFIESKTIKFIDLFENKFVKKGAAANINKCCLNTLKRESAVPVVINRCKSIIRKECVTPVVINIYKSIVKKESIGIHKTYDKEHFKITKRWWIISPGTEVDEKILPLDYDYLEHPLLGSPGLGYIRISYPDKNNFRSSLEYEQACLKLINRMIENMKVQYFIKNKDIIPYEYLPKIYKAHPNSININPYIKHDDRIRGVYEIPMAINIMIEMVNFVALIVHHWASQLCYCTGQEAMWFIMEALDNWLNLDTTIDRLSKLNAKEHYNRAYRWIRWEAEKVFFNCDYAKERGRFRGLKYAGQLLSNLIGYMKNHHFNIVPIWHDVSRMDYWRAQHNLDDNPSDDILIRLDKVKCKRHLNIETKRLDKKSTEGTPKK